METKRIYRFTIEVYELDFFNENENGFRLIFDYQLGYFIKEMTTHRTITPSSYKKIYTKIVNTESKLNKELGVNDYKKYYIQDSLNEAIKGARTLHDFRSLSKVLIVKKS